MQIGSVYAVTWMLAEERRGNIFIASPLTCSALVFCRIVFLETVSAVFYAKAAVRLRGQLDVIHGAFIRNTGLGRSARSLIGNEFFRHVVLPGAFCEVQLPEVFESR